MANIGRYIRHPAAGTTGATDWFDADRPLGAGRVQLFLANNIQHLLVENAMRVLVTHPGARALYRGPVIATTSTPSAYDVQWDYGPTGGGVSLCLGTHYVWKIPGTSRFPKLVARGTWWVGSNEPTFGLSLFVAPGRSAPTLNIRGSGTTTTAKTRAAWERSIALVESDLQPAVIAPRAEGSGTPGDELGELYLFTAYLGGYVSADNDAAADHGHITGITLCLEEP